MIKKINSLTKIFLKDINKNFRIFNKKKKIKLKDSSFFWMIIIIAIAVAFFSYKAIEFFNSIGQPRIFLTIYFIIFTILLLFEIILVVINVLFFSKELEYVLPMPISSIELLISKYAVLLVMTYITELIFSVVPLTIYGLLTHISLLYFLVMPIVLIIFPALFITIISVITIILMTTLKVIKNRNIYQTVVTSILLLIVLSFESIIMSTFTIERPVDIDQQNISQEQAEQQAIEMYKKMGKGFLVVNPSVEILAVPNNILSVLTNFGKLIIYNLVGLSIFLLVGKKIYLKNILIGTTNFISSKSYIGEVKYESKDKKIRKSYIEKDFKQLVRNPTFFMQLVFPVILILLSMLIIGNFIIPVLDTMIQSDDNIRNSLKNIEFNANMVCIFLCVLQVLFSMSAISLTAVSREGKSAIFLKYMPVDLYKQFLYKNVLQIILNFIVSITVLGIIYFLISRIGIIEILLIFAISIFMNFINSFLMLVVDLRRPILDWDSEYQITKNNPNKIFQYVFMIIMVLALMYLAKILGELSVIFSLGIQLLIFMIVFVIINVLIKKNIEKLFSKIN